MGREGRTIAASEFDATTCAERIAALFAAVDAR
jgi:hypothetical protein